MAFFVGHDLGTGGDKAVLVDEGGRLLAERVATYPLHHPRPGHAEQDPRDWWNAVAEATRGAVADAGVSPNEVKGIAFAGQMLSLAPLDAKGEPTRPAITWIDARAGEQAKRLVRRMGGETILHLVAGGSPSAKDLVSKVAWIREEEPSVFEKTAALCDATGYLVSRATGRLLMDPTAAGGTGLFDLGDRTFSRALAFLAGFPLDKMPPIVASTDVAGPLTAAAAKDLGLSVGLPVAMGLSDIPSAAVGSGAVRPGDAHVYLGTSSWIAVTVDRAKSVPRAGIASVPSADRSGCLLVGESETAGACREWLGKLLPGADGADFDALAARAEPGARGLLFLPWMYGERSPIPDSDVRGGFVNLSLEHGAPHLARAVLEGVALNLRWILDACVTVGEPCRTLRAIGGGAASDLWLQIIADVTGRAVSRVVHPRQAGAVGCALLAAVATNYLPDLAAIAKTVKVETTFQPDPSRRALYDTSFTAFREMHPPLSRLGRALRRT
jgi:xylulokinase